MTEEVDNFIDPPPAPPLRGGSYRPQVRTLENQNKHSWVTGDDHDLVYREVIDVGASGEVHEVCLSN